MLLHVPPRSSTCLLTCTTRQIRCCQVYNHQDSLHWPPHALPHSTQSFCTFSHAHHSPLIASIVTPCVNCRSFHISRNLHRQLFHLPPLVALSFNCSSHPPSHATSPSHVPVVLPGCHMHAPMRTHVPSMCIPRIRSTRSKIGSPRPNLYLIQFITFSDRFYPIQSLFIPVQLVSVQFHTCFNIFHPVQSYFNMFQIGSVQFGQFQCIFTPVLASLV